MNEHYFTPLPESQHKPAQVCFEYRGHSLKLETDSGVFSRLELDRGTEVLLDALPQTLCGGVLDMGCGYGAIGVAIGSAYPQCQITMSDVNQRACGLASQNARTNGVAAEVLIGNGYETVKGRKFDFILQNPPIRAGKSVIYQMFADAKEALSPDGRLYLVIRKQQGAPSAQNYLQTLFAQVRAASKKSGFWVFECKP